jgi:protein-disulfide isomerase
MNTTLPPLLCSLALLLALSGCATGPTPGSQACYEEIPDCGSQPNQRLLTYCVSPGAAIYAARSQRVRDALARGAQVPPVDFPLPIGDSPTQGPEDAAVTIVVFSDLECPFCAQAHANLEALRTLRPNDVRVVYKHFPLDSIHPQAVEAAQAARAAQAQGLFWDFVDALYQRQGELGPALYAEVIRAAGGDPAALDQVRVTPAVGRDVAADRTLGDAIGVTGTPTIFLNGVQIPADADPQGLADVVDQQRAAAQAFLAAGVPPDEIYARMVLAQWQPPEPDGGEDPEASEGSLVFIPAVGAPSRGAKPEDALATLVIFSDFECPFCAGLNPAIDAALAKHPQLRVVFRHFPLPSHDRADNAAGLAVLADQAGRFWEAHDALFAQQDAFEDADLQALSDKLGLGIPDVNAAMRAPEVAEVINRDMTMAVEAGVTATPSFFINGRMLIGVYSVAELDEVVAEQIELGARIQAETGKSGEDLYEATVAAQLDEDEL